MTDTPLVLTRAQLAQFSRIPVPFLSNHAKDLDLGFVPEGSKRKAYTTNDITPLREAWVSKNPGRRTLNPEEVDGEKLKKYPGDPMSMEEIEKILAEANNVAKTVRKKKPKTNSKPPVEAAENEALEEAVPKKRGRRKKAVPLAKQLKGIQDSLEKMQDFQTLTAEQAALNKAHLQALAKFVGHEEMEK